MNRKLITLVFFIILSKILCGQVTCLNPGRVEVLPVFFVPKNVSFPDSTVQKDRIRQHLVWSQNRYKEMLGSRATFKIADTGALIYHGTRTDSYYKTFTDRGAAAYLEELLPYLGYTRFNCPFVILVVYIDYNTNFPLAGGRTFNGGINTGGGVIIISGADLKFLPNFQSTLQHELGHGFGLPHVDSYGYNMNTNASVMSYNPSHQTNFFTPSATPGTLIPEDIRNLSLNKLALSGLAFDSAKDIPTGYTIYEGIPLVGMMDIPGEYSYKITATTTSGETYNSSAGNLVQNEIKLSYPGMPFAYDAQNMWHSGEVADWANVTIKFPFIVTLDKIGIHTQHSGLYQKADSIRIEKYNNNNFSRITEQALPDVDEYISFKPTTDSVFRFQFKPGITKMVTIRGIEFFNNNEVVFPPRVPYILRNPQKKLLAAKAVLNMPADSSIIQSFLVPLSWSGPQSITYKLQIDTCKDFCSPVFEGYIQNAAFSYPIKVMNKKYFWRVKGLNTIGQGFGEWSDIRHFQPQAAAVFNFTGNGSYFTAANWENNMVPPNPVPAGVEVRLKSGNSSECRIDQTVTFLSGSRLSVAPNTNVRLVQNVIIQ